MTGIENPGPPRRYLSDSFVRVGEDDQPIRLVASVVRWNMNEESFVRGIQIIANVCIPSFWNERVSRERGNKVAGAGRNLCIGTRSKHKCQESHSSEFSYHQYESHARQDQRVPDSHKKKTLYASMSAFSRPLHSIVGFHKSKFVLWYRCTQTAKCGLGAFSRCVPNNPTLVSPGPQTGNTAARLRLGLMRWFGIPTNVRIEPEDS